MNKATPIRGICFDLWNTLAFTDHSPNPISALASAFALEAVPRWRQIIEDAIMTRPLAGIGEAIDVIASCIGRGLSSSMTRRDLILLWGAACNRNRWYPDALSTLMTLRSGSNRYRLGIVSNTQSFDLEFLRRDANHLVDAVCLSCHEGILKPDPKIFHQAALLLGLPVSEVLMVGDRVKDDIEGAMAAGMRGVLLDRSGSTGWQGRSIASLNDLPGLIQRM
jgi:FMN phosphatase YigB (HAD superfamily)